MDLAHIFQSGIPKEYAKGEYIYLPQQTSERIYLILKGKVKLGVFGENNKEIIHSLLEEEDIFGEKAVLGEKIRTEFAQASENTKLIFLNINTLSKSVIIEMTSALIDLIAIRRNDFEDRLSSLVYKDSRTRVIEYLLQRIDKKGVKVGFEIEVREVINHNDIAQIAATSRQTVTTILNELRSKNLLTFDRKRILVRNLAGLRDEVKNQ